MLSIDYNDSEIGELMALGYHSHLSTSCLVSAYQHRGVWTKYCLLYIYLHLSPFQVVFSIKSMSFGHQLKDNTTVYLLSGKGGLDYTELWETLPYFF